MNWRKPWSWRPGEDPAELVQRLRGIAQRKIANELVRAFYLDRDPAHIVRACEEWRRGGMRLPPGWLRAEIWAKAQPRKRGRRSIAPRIVRMLHLAALFWYWPSEGEGFRRRIPSDLKRTLARECGLSLSEVSKYMSLSRKAMARTGAPIPPGARVVTHRIW
jgi:hypothetical protein